MEAVVEEDIYKEIARIFHCLGESGIAAHLELVTDPETGDIIGMGLAGVVTGQRNMANEPAYQELGQEFPVSLALAREAAFIEG